MAHLTQGSIDKIAQHAGALNLILQYAGDIARAQETGNAGDFETAALSIGNLWSRRLSNDCGSIFKELYNRQRGA